MLVLNQKVPDALILPEMVSDLRKHLSEEKAHWFCSEPEFIDRSKDTENAVTAIRSATTDTTAIQTQPNKDNGLCVDIEGSSALAFQDGVHCGFMIPDMPVDANNWSCAVRFNAPQNSARTLLTLNSEDTKNYFFLQQTMGQIVFKDQLNTSEIKQKNTGDSKKTVLLAGYSDNRLWMRVDDGELLCSDPAEIALARPCTLFIGCRSNKGRLLKTLGEFNLFDTIFWPDKNVLSPEFTQTQAALNDEYLWRASV